MIEFVSMNVEGEGDIQLWNPHMYEYLSVDASAELIRASRRMYEALMRMQAKLNVGPWGINQNLVDPCMAEFIWESKQDQKPDPISGVAIEHMGWDKFSISFRLQGALHWNDLKTHIEKDKYTGESFTEYAQSLGKYIGELSMEEQLDFIATRIGR